MSETTSRLKVEFGLARPGRRPRRVLKVHAVPSIFIPPAGASGAGPLSSEAGTSGSNNVAALGDHDSGDPSVHFKDTKISGGDELGCCDSEIPLWAPKRSLDTRATQDYQTAVPTREQLTQTAMVKISREVQKTPSVQDVGIQVDIGMPATRRGPHNS